MRSTARSCCTTRATDGIYRFIDGLRARGWILEPRYERAYVVYEVTGRPKS